MKRLSALLAAVAICTAIATNASAEANLALRGIGLKAGVVNPEDISSTLGFGLVADLGTVHPNVALESYAGYWSQTESEFGAEVGVKDFSFGSKAKYMFTTSNPSMQPFAGAGLGLHIVNAHVDVPGFSFGGITYPGTSASDTEVRLGLDLGGGLRIDRGSQFAFLGEAWYSAVSDVSQFSVMVGAVYMFGR
ncbi:MAG: outer membrane beta-barrel protein [Candidatus Krumholzibacteria bacterium]|nr:outer membrane beta-barrel protein [Candidatus Krumholzibacteria bacterium]MDH4337340.1 outer membrane beta-barrel protein [Candidatus Krumholzibacteria bacterium]MDH5270101.1 outer membrane beta-barrel protein [Candidatus Krumholzibacteria bacterium]MDH5627268.1 outer membrane beta-barrel protein [Candidatus Krumholzibacteria bacterium]